MHAMCRKKLFAQTIFLGTAACLLAVSLGTARALTSTTVALTNSVRPVNETAVTDAPSRPYISRHDLTSAETSAPMTFEVSLKMRNLAELESRINQGEQIPSEEMAAKYEPQAADYEAVVNWLQGEGFTIVHQDPRHILILVRGKVSHVASALKVTFARVKSNGKEYTSAISAPSVPTDISPLLIGINGLQPHLRAHKHILKAAAQTNASAGGASYLPSQIATAYGLTGLYNKNITGSGQTIAIVIDLVPSTTDLLLFWKNCSVNQSISNVQFVQPVIGSLSPASIGDGEETLDTEWSSAMAPGAHVRVYAATDLGSADLDTTYQQIITDATNHPEYGIHQMSMSFGIGEVDVGESQVDTDHALFVELANLGITIFASSGDYGTTPDIADHSDSVQVESPASDPDVTGVGGTSLQLNSNNTIVSTGETVWNTFSQSGRTVNGGASGGGMSAYFQAPAFQGLPLVNNQEPPREVPDVAASADPDYGATIYFNGTKTTVGGTSWASPTWAGICALINQARADAGQAPLGILGPHIYSLLQTANLNEVTSGNNDTASGTGYSAASDYNMATGVGTPNGATLAKTLIGSSTLAGVQMAPAMKSVTPGLSATFTAAAAGTSATYQWQRKPLGSTTYTTLSNTSTYSGIATGTLTVTDATEAMSGDSFECVVTLDGTTVTTTPSVLVVDSPLSISALAGAVGVGALTDGSGTGANFDIPSGIALDASGNLYIADYADNAVRKVTPGGTVTTPFGAVFDEPNSVAIDGSGDLFVANSGNNLILEVAHGTTSVTTFASGFNTPEGVATDSSNNVYVADTFNDCIDEITPGGKVTTIAGEVGTAGYQDGAAINGALFNSPASVAVDSSGNIYVADTGNCVIRKITGGTVSTLAGIATTSGYLDGPGTSALFNCPAGITVDSFGSIYVADALAPYTAANAAGNDLVRRITAAGAVSTLAGQAGNEGSAVGTGTAALFFSMQAVAVNSSTGEFYLADAYNNTIREGLLVPTVSVSATREAQTTAPVAGQFTITRSGSPVGSLPLNYTFGGTAVAGSDYHAISTSTTLTPGASSEVLSINPITNSSATVNPTLQLALTSSSLYLVGSPSSATMIIQETTPYQTWAQNNFGSSVTNPAIAGESADPNNNGVPNLLEYAFNSNPLQAGTEPLPVVTTVEDSNGKEHLEITYTQINNDPDLTCTVQVTSDLTQATDIWHSGSSYTTVIGTPVVTGTTTQTTVEDNTPATSVTPRFIRIQVND
jgi:kumamolisin